MDNQSSIQKKEPPSIGQMILKLEGMYKRQHIVMTEAKICKNELFKLKNEYEQLEDDIKLLEMMIFHQSNKNKR